MFENQRPIERDKLNDQVYERLCVLLRQGEFTPGEAVTVARVASAFGVSAMPVREALTRLLAVGVLTNVSGRSVGVPELTYDELHDLKNVRLEVEGMATLWAVENCDEPFLKRLDELLKAMEEAEANRDLKGHIKANYSFHQTIYAQSKSEVLLNIIDTLWLRVSPHLYRLSNHYKASNVHHRKIVEMFYQRNGAGAAQALREDITDAYRVLVKSQFNITEN